MIDQILPSPLQLFVTWNQNIYTEAELINILKAGAVGFRLVTKGFTPDKLRQTAERLVHIGQSARTDFQLIIDLPGQKPRLIRDIPKIELKRKDQVSLLFTSEGKNVLKNEFPTEYLEQYIDQIKLGHRVLIADGTVILQVEKKFLDRLVCSVIKGAEVTGGRSMNLPDSNLKYVPFSPKDVESLSVLRGIDISSICISMVNNANDVREIRELMKSLNMRVPIISKIETKQGLKNFPEIASCSDSIMIGRGDMSMELPIASLGVLQNYIISSATAFNSDIIMATGILSSIQKNEQPSIAEVVDVTSLFENGIRKYLLGDFVTRQREGIIWMNQIYSEWLKFKLGVSATVDDILN